MIEGRVVRGIDATAPSFIKSFGRIKDPNLREEIKTVLQRLLFLKIDEAPAKLHMHQLKSKQVTSRLDSTRKITAWSLHVTANDAYKASFTYEDGVLYFRLVDEHDVIDSNP